MQCFQFGSAENVKKNCTCVGHISNYARLGFVQPFAFSERTHKSTFETAFLSVF
ncbi:MAG: hypothetical protein RJA34_2999 [Pseudomonadota bacterium]